MPAVTLVTCLFDLAGREPACERRSAADYFQAAERWLLGLDHDLIVFADPQWVAPIAAARRELGIRAQTRVIAATLEEFRAYSQLGAITRARAEHPLQNGDPNKDTSLYTVLQWAKFELIARTATELSSTPHLAWIDVGLRSRPYPGEDPFLDRAERLRLLMLRPFFAVELSDPDRYFGWQWGHLAAGYICGSRENMAWLAARFEDLARTTLAAGFAASDEQLLPLIAAAEPDLFDFHHGDYDHALTNYRRPHGSAHNLTMQLRAWRDSGAPGVGASLARAVVDSVGSGQFLADPDALAELLDECFLAAFYGEDEASHASAGRVAELYLSLAESDPTFRDSFLRDEIRIRKNFAFAAAARQDAR